MAGLAERNLADYVFVSADAGELDLVRRWLDHDPRPALRRIACPVLALFGGEDRVVPVSASVEAFREARAGRPGGLTVEVFPGGNHRLQVGEPPALHPDYGATLTGWIGAVGA